MRIWRELEPIRRQAKSLLNALLPVYLAKWMGALETNSMIEAGLDLVLIKVPLKGSMFYIPVKLDPCQKEYSFEYEGKQYLYPPALLYDPSLSELVKFKEIQ